MRRRMEVWEPISLSPGKENSDGASQWVATISSGNGLSPIEYRPRLRRVKVWQMVAYDWIRLSTGRTCDPLDFLFLPRLFSLWLEYIGGDRINLMA